ncbi:MAG: hypothetical protein EPN25_00680 [Nitrospirae bacterium]|nr:MAG: hypothetical protein EPN25_00680 [Nitrospirota bacterium]
MKIKQSLSIVQQRTYASISVFISFVLIILVSLTLCGCTVTKKYGPYSGKVVDSETKQPLEGAAVLIVFHTVSATVGGAVFKYADAVETETDKNGEFKVESKRILKTGILQRWDDNGYVTIFKPGYGCYPEHIDSRPLILPSGTIPEKNYVVFELPSLKTKEQREKYLCGRNLAAPLSKQRHLIRLLNRERRALGYETFYSEDTK